MALFQIVLAKLCGRPFAWDQSKFAFLLNRFWNNNSGDNDTNRNRILISNLNVNEGVFGTQVEQQLQDGTICALCVSCCRFGLVSSIFPELQNSQCSTAAGHPLPAGWIHVSLCPDLPE